MPRMTLPVKLLTAGLCSILVFFASLLTVSGPQSIYVIILFSVTFLSFAVWFCRDASISGSPILFALFLLLIAAGMFARICMLEHRTGDYNDFLVKWVQHFRDNGLDAFKTSIANYNMPYLYFLAVFSRIPLNDLYLIKWLSVVFDMLLAVSGMLIVRHFRLGAVKEMLTAAALWLAPTVWLNSALWGQCDSIYAAFIVFALLFILKNRPWLSVAMAALAFSFKLQAVFFLPAYIIFLFAKKVKLRHALMFPAVFALSVLPALAFGAPLKDVSGVYWGQIGLYSQYLNLNSPSMYALLPNEEGLSTFGVVSAFAFVLLMYTLCLIKKDKLTDKALILAAMLFCAAIPWLLPHMHERYFYLADVLAVIVAVLVPRAFYIAPLTIFASYGGYHAYLYLQFIFPSGLKVFSVCMLASACISLILLVLELFFPKREIRLKESL